MKKTDTEEHQVLALWASACAEHVLTFFEEIYPDDRRPRDAIEAARAWVRDEIKMTEARKFAFASHAAARDATNLQAKAVARAAGHAAATAHVATHAKYAASYALKASADELTEKAWQLNQLPENLKLTVEL